MNDYKRAKEEIDKISSSFCAAKWTQGTIYLQNGTTHSCHHPTVHNIPLTELAENPTALHNTNYKKEQRKLMLEGQRPKECEYCWNIEAQPNGLFRLLMILLVSRGMIIIFLKH